MKKYYKGEEKGGNALSVLITIILLILCLFVIFACRSSLTVDNSVVSSLDVNRYLGKWYEVARFNHKFERDMDQCTAVYLLQENGTIKVVNQGMRNGKLKTAVGKAKLTDTPGLLRVSFFGPFYSDYRVMMLDPNYSYALVGSNANHYLWILARTPQLENNTRNQIIREAQRRGYNTDHLIWVDQSEQP